MPQHSGQRGFNATRGWVKMSGAVYPEGFIAGRTADDTEDFDRASWFGVVGVVCVVGGSSKPEPQ